MRLLGGGGFIYVPFLPRVWKPLPEYLAHPRAYSSNFRQYIAFYCQFGIPSGRRIAPPISELSAISQTNGEGGSTDEAGRAGGRNQVGIRSMKARTPLNRQYACIETQATTKGPVEITARPSRAPVARRISDSSRDNRRRGVWGKDLIYADGGANETDSARPMRSSHSRSRRRIRTRNARGAPIYDFAEYPPPRPM